MTNDQMLFGCKVQISKPSPRMRCSPEFVRIQSPELVAETNAWMATFFGYADMMADGEVFKLRNEWSGDVLVMNQRTYKQMREAISHDE